MNDVKNDRVIRPITIKEVNGNYKLDKIYENKVIYYYNNISLYKDGNLNIDNFKTAIYNKILKYSDNYFLNNIPSSSYKEIMNNPVEVNFTKYILILNQL